MRSKSIFRSSRIACLKSGAALTGLALSLSMAGAAAAQDAGESDDDAIVVVGTSIRNVAPAGAQEFTVSAAQIESKSVQSTGELMATIPQMFNFGNLQTVNSGGIQLTVNRTNIRSLPQSIGGSSPTLILLDGHRIVGMGVKQSYPDPDVIPPFLIERVEVLTDGGSAIYGSDAVGGVLNFVTKRNFDGVQAGVRQSFGDDYRATDVNVAVGKAWDTGSAYVAYNFARHNAVYGSSRGFIKAIDWNTFLPTSKNCSPANVTVGGQTYAVVGGNSLQLGNDNLCDRSDTQAFYPRQDRHSVMGGFRQDLNDSIEIEIKGYYSQRRNLNDGGPLQGNASVLGADVPANPGFPPFVPPSPAQFANPNYISIGGGDTSTQAVGFDFGPVNGFERTRTKLWSYGFTPTLTWKIPGDWQMKALFNYGKSRTTAFNPGTNDQAIAARVLDGTLNPYNVVQSSPTAIAEALDFLSYGEGKASLLNAKATVDGPLFPLPAGELRVAVGGEYIKEKFAGITAENTVAAAIATPLARASRSVKSAFGEASIPVVGPDMEWPIHSIDLSASVRFDDYSDFGSNWAPNLGVSVKPVEWLNLRARWNKSFQAPSIVNLSQAGTPTIGVNPAFIFNFVPLLLNPAVPSNGGPLVAMQGAVSPLQPQKARNYNLGFDISPPFVDGLDIHFTYFNIDYRGTIGQPALGFGPFYNVPAFQNSFIMLPTIAQIEQFLTERGGPPAAIANAIAAVQAQGGNAYAVADVRQRNLGVTKLDGFDVSFDYSHPVSFGSIYANFNSTYLNSSVTAADGTNFEEDAAGVDGSRFNSTFTVGATVGDNFRGQLTWTHRHSYRLRAPAALNQTRVGAFDPFNLFMQYDIDQGSLPPVTLSLGVDNMFNSSPPLFRAVDAAGNAGYANGNPLGRVVHLGASLEF